MWVSNSKVRHKSRQHRYHVTHCLGHHAGQNIRASDSTGEHIVCLPNCVCNYNGTSALQCQQIWLATIPLHAGTTHMQPGNEKHTGSCTKRKRPAHRRAGWEAVLTSHFARASKLASQNGHYLIAHKLCNHHIFVLNHKLIPLRDW